jgi:energy-coupling factor transport system substrate-specific component
MTLAKRSGFSTRELVLYGLLGGLMTASQVAMAALPNIHIVGVLVLLCAQVFGLRALYPVYIFVTLEILIFGMGLWAINYLYVWAILVLIGVVLKKTHAGRFAWAAAAGVFGMLFGALCAIPHYFLGGWSMAFAYWISGIPYDLIHGVANFALTLILLPPLSRILSQVLQESK